MKVVEEVVRRRQTIAVDDPGRAYPEIRDLLERRMVFSEVHEEKYYNDVDEGTIRSRIVTSHGMDKHTTEQFEIFLFISKNSRELDIQVKGKLVTEYDTSGGYRNTLWYYAYRALYEKFLYGHIRHGYEESVEEKVEELIHRVRENLEAEN